MTDLATRCRRAQWACLSAAFLLVACGGGATVKEQSSVSAPATAPAPAASSPAGAPAPAPAASAPTPAPPPVSLPPIPGPVDIPGAGSGLNTTTLATGSGTVFTSPLTAQQSLDIASSAYRATKVLDQQIRFVARMGSNLVTSFSALNAASYREDKVACSKTGTSTSSWVKSSGDTASLGWTQGDTLTIIFDECRYDDGERIHGRLVITAQRNMSNVRAGVGMQFALQFTDFATPLDGVSTALSTGGLSVGAALSSASGIIANYAGSAGYVMNVVDGFGIATTRIDALTGFSGGTSADAAREARSFAGQLRIRRTGSAGFASDGQAVIQISPSLQRLIGSTDWQRESGAGAMAISSMPGAGNGRVLLSANADVATVSVDHQADGVIDMVTTTTMTLMGTGAAQANSANTQVINPPPASVATPTIPTTGTSSVAGGTSTTTPTSFTNSVVVSADAALEFGREAFSQYKLLDPQARAVLDAAHQMVLGFAGVQSSSFENSVTQCGASGQFLMSLQKVSPGSTFGLKGNGGSTARPGDMISIVYQNCSWWEDQSWTGTVTVELESDTTTNAPGTVISTIVNAQQLSMPAIATTGRAMVNAGFLSRMTVMASSSSRDSSYAWYGSGSVAVGGKVFKLNHGPVLPNRAAVGASFTEKTQAGTSRSLVIDGWYWTGAASEATVMPYARIQLSQPLAANGAAGTLTGTMDLKFNPIPFGQAYDDKLRVNILGNNVQINVDRNDDGINDITLNTTLASLGG